MNNRKRFEDLFYDIYIDTPLYIVNKTNGEVKNGKYKGDGILPMGKKTIMYFTINGNTFMNLVEIPNKRLHKVEKDNYVITPSITIAKELQEKYAV